jgi:hypothetical protein
VPDCWCAENTGFVVADTVETVALGVAFRRVRDTTPTAHRRTVVAEAAALSVEGSR